MKSKIRCSPFMKSYLTKKYTYLNKTQVNKDKKE